MSRVKRKFVKVVLLALLGLAPFAARGGTSVDLEIGMTIATNAVLLGDQFSFYITVSNASANAATGVVLSDQLPVGWQYLYSEVGQGSINAAGNSIDFSLGTIPPGIAVTGRVFVAPQSPGWFTNLAVVNADQPNTGSTSPVLFGVNAFLPTPPLITKQPQNQLLNLGGLLNLVVEVLSGPGTRYQWRLNGANIPGATNATYSVLKVLSKDAGEYTAVVYNQLGAAVSQPALVSLTGLLQLGASDSFANRGPVLNLLDLMSYSNVGASSEPGEPLHAGVPGGHSVWFTWTPLLSGVATFTTDGSSFDTLLAVYTGTSLTNLTEVASDDDSAGFYRSKVVFNAVAGTHYAIAVDGAYGAQGQIILNSSLQLLTPPVPQITARPANQVTGLGGTALFAVSATGNKLSYQWLFNDAVIPGANGPSLELTSVDLPQVGLYRVRVSSGSQSILSVAASLQIGMMDGQEDASSQAQDKFQAEAGAAMGGSTQVKAQLKMTRSGGAVHPLSSGTSRGYTGMQVFSTYASATQTGEPNNCSNPGGSSSWAALQPSANGALTLNTRGSNFKTILGVYTGNGADFSSLVPVACDVGTDTNANNGQVSFAATASTTYYISVDGVDGAYGTVVLNWALSVPPAITSQTPSQTLPVGASVTLSVTTSGYPAPSCQWLCNGSPLSGATNWSLKITNFQPAAQGSYQMLARNASGTAATAPATLAVYSGLQFDSAAMNCTNGAFQFQLIGAANSNYVIEASQDLVHWVPVATNTPSTGLWRFADPQSASVACRFYRALPQ